jgi:hypothetical protein
MAFLSIFTNVILFAYVSDQIDNVFPSLKKQSDDSSSSLLTLFAFEHLLLGVAIFLRLFMSGNPKWVDVFMARYGYKKKNKGADKMVKMGAFLK